MAPESRGARHFLRAVVPLLLAVAVVAAARFEGARHALNALGLFTGPLGLLLVASALGVCLLRALSWPLFRPARLPVWLLFAVPLLLGGLVGQRYARAVEPSGDEIDYLLMAQSVWREGDVDLRDNFERGDQLEYLGGLDHMPGGTRDEQGRYRPTHSAGLALVLAPVYAAGGRAACVLFLALAGAGLALAVHRLARETTGDEAAATVAWAAAVGPPVLFYTAFLYTEVVVALCLALALLLLLRSPGPARAALAALFLAALPWLHVRLAPAAGLTGLAALVSLRGRARAAFAATAAVMAAGWIAYQWSAFGTLSPFERYGGVPPIPVLRATPLRTLIGLFVDGAYGLLPYAPVFLLALPALPRLRERRLWPLAAAGLGVLLPVLGWRNWWGFSPPARFTVPLVPILAAALALHLADAKGRGLARWRWPLVAWGLALTALMFAEPHEMRMVNGRDGPPAVYEELAGQASLSRYLPFLSSRAGSTAPPWEPPASEALVAFVAVAALALVLGLDRLARVNDRVDRWFAGLALPLAILLIVSLAVDRWARPAGPPRSGQAVELSAS